MAQTNTSGKKPSLIDILLDSTVEAIEELVDGAANMTVKTLDYVEKELKTGTYSARTTRSGLTVKASTPNLGTLVTKYKNVPGTGYVCTNVDYQIGPFKVKIK